MTHPREPEPLRPMLEATQSELTERLQEACGHAVEGESTAELVRLEETLSEAARVAKQAVSLRRRLRTGHGAAAAGAAADAHSGQAGVDTVVPRTERRSMQPDDRPQEDAGDQIAVREFLDRRGTSWRVWAVTQEQLHPERPGAERMGEYRDGWLAFECGGGSERRRLPHYPPNWQRLSNLELEGLLERAEAVRRKRAGGEDADTTLTS